MYFREFNIYEVRGVIMEKIESSDVSAHSSNTDHIKEGFPWCDSPVTTEILAGIVQTTGWPGVVSAVGKWFGKEKRGLIFGIWNSHTSIGNILGSVIAGEFVETNWGVSFIVPGAIIAFGGFIIFLFLVENPSNVHCDLPTSGEDKRERDKSPELARDDSKNTGAGESKLAHVPRCRCLRGERFSLCQRQTKVFTKIWGAELLHPKSCVFVLGRAHTKLVEGCRTMAILGHI
ncbi:unnamed protein product, partial [Timema podura]|nr:unnamed protein product [Timema podura]